MKVETRVGIFVIAAIGIFFYLSLNIQAIRLDKAQYYVYKTYFDDTGGLDEKAPVKIAGVEVGWVENVNLLEGGKAEVILRVHKRNRLSRNAYAMVQQEGLIGTKSIELEPGDPTTGTLQPGSMLAMPGRPPTSVGDLLEQFKDIASGVQDIVTSFKTTFATREGEKNMQRALSGIAEASNRMASFSEVLDRTLRKNEKNIDATLADLKKTMAHLEYGVPQFTDDFHGVSGALQDDVFPTLNEGVEKVTVALADEALPSFRDASDHAGNAFVQLGDAAVDAKGMFSGATDIVTSLNEGKGTLGKLLTEDETYQDIKGAVKGLKNMVGKADKLELLIDMHTENLFKTDNSKGYFELKLRPLNDYFYTIQMVADENGSIRETVREYKRYDANGNQLKTSTLITARDRIEFADRIEKKKQIKDDILFGFQFGKRFDRVALRVGLFESTFGAGIDYYVPLNTDKFHWITTLEAFDFKGKNRMEDDRPHLKWLNKLYFMKNVYTTFGVDDMVSKRNASPFFGGGIRFGDDDLKYLLSSLGGGIKKK